MKLLAFGMALALAAPVLAQKTEKPDSTEARTALEKDTRAFETAWNKHDAKAMAETWATDATLINPEGRKANGREEITKLLADEHRQKFGKSTMAMRIDTVRMITPDVAVVDMSAKVTGATGPDGKPMREMDHHIMVVAAKRAGDWTPVDVRPYLFIPMDRPSGAGGN